MHNPLNLIERRVLGVLLEKALAQPEYYPMTLNAVVTACNQKNNRDPVMNLDEDAVWHALEQLRQNGLASKVLPGAGSRVDRFKHEVDAKWQWPKAQKALMAELLLRGPQTLGEMRTRGSRLYAFDNLESVSAVLDWLSSQTPPWIRILPRGAGQSADRYAHLLYPEDEAASLASESPTSRSAPLSSPPSALANNSADELRSQLEAVQSEVAELHELVANLTRRLERLEGR